MVITQTLNEQRNIKSFCEGYNFADKILVIDGGSTDKTREFAAEFDNVKIINASHLNVEGLISKQGLQINLGIERAKELNADWIIKDDCDSWPNSHLKKEVRQIIESADEAAIFAYHLYIWGIDQYFPKMNHSGPGLWAWQPAKANIYAARHFVAGLRNVPTAGLKVDLPLALLHYSWPDEQVVQQKQARAKFRGDPWVHPLEGQYAPPEPLPEAYL